MNPFIFMIIVMCATLILMTVHINCSIKRYPEQYNSKQEHNSGLEK